MRRTWLGAAVFAVASSLCRLAAAETALVGLAEGNLLLRFTAERPGAVEQVRITGANAPLLGIDVRPADAVLYAVSSANDLYAIDPAAGTARMVSTLTQGFDGSPRSAFDFNPQADRLRLIAATGQNLRVQVSLGAVAVDGPLVYAAGDPHAGDRPRVTAAAYTDNVAAAPTTRLFDIDSEADVLALQDPPNDGALRTVGALGVDFGATGGFDIRTQPGGQQDAFAASGATLYAIDLATGAARALGTIGDGRIALIGLAALP